MASVPIARALLKEELVMCRVCQCMGSFKCNVKSQGDYHFIINLLVPNTPKSLVPLCEICETRVEINAEFLQLCRQSHYKLMCMQGFKVNATHAESSAGSGDTVEVKEEKSENTDSDEWGEFEMPAPVVLLSPPSPGEYEDEMFDEMDTNLEQVDSVTDTKIHRKTIKAKKKLPRRPTDDDSYKMITLTKEQIIQEMTERSKSERYLASPYKCHDCVKIFNYEQVLVKHMRKHREESGLHECEFCKQRFPSQMVLLRHQRSHSKRFACRECDLVRLSRFYILEHYNEAHSTAVRHLICDVCGYAHTKRAQFLIHMRTHFPGPSLSCHICGKQFQNAGSLRHHELRHNDKGSYQCPECPKCYKHVDQLRAHRRSHRTDRDKSGLYCVECDVTFTCKSNLQVHLRESWAHRVPEHVCLVCSKRFSKQRTLATHIAWAHEGRRDYACEHCGRRYGTAHGLARHVKADHEAPVERATCDRCNKTFKTVSILKKHFRVHTGERPFECKECGQKFAQSGTLYTHIRLVHKKLPRRPRGRSIKKSPPRSNRSQTEQSLEDN